MTEPLQYGRYSKTMRKMSENTKALESFANRILREKDEQIAALTAERDKYRAALEVISGSSDRLQAAQAACALQNIGPDTSRQSE